MMAVSLRLYLAAALGMCARGDQGLSGGGIFMKIQGQSGKMTFATSEPIGSAHDRVQIQMVSLEELAADGTVVGRGGSAKHSFNSFATQSFTFGAPMARTITGVERDVAAANGLIPDSPNGGYITAEYNVTTVSFTSYLGSGNPATDSKLEIESIIFKENAILKFQNPDGSFIYPAVAEGTLKFNVKMSQWNWCANNCKSSDGVGDSVRLTIEMINQVVVEADSDDESADATTNSSKSFPDCSSGACENGAVEDLGGVFLSVLNTYMIQAPDGTVTQFTLPKNPSLTIDPPPSTKGADKRTTTLVLEFPRANFAAHDTLIYDPILSYESIDDASAAGTSSGDEPISGDSGDDTDATTTSTDPTFQDGTTTTTTTTPTAGDDSDGVTTSQDGTTTAGDDSNDTTASQDGTTSSTESVQPVSHGNSAYQVYHSLCILMLLAV